VVHDSDEVATQGVEIDFVSETSREGFKGLNSVVLVAVEALINEVLDAGPSGTEKGRYGKG
jgi:hypothetical protein